MAVAVPVRRRRRPWRASPLAAALRERLPVLAGFVLLALVSLYLGRAVAAGATRNAAALALLPALVLLVWFFSSGRRHALLFVALAVELVPFTAVPAEPLFGPAYLADGIVVLAICTWLVDRLLGGPGAALPRTPVLGWPLLLFALSLLPGLIEGYDRYGASLFGQPSRLVAYAGIACALTRISPREAYRGIVVVFYVGTFLQALAALYYMGTGGSATDAELLSTGGARILALSTAMYLAGAVVLALLNLELDPRRRLLHLAVAALALFGIVVSFGRTTYVAVAVLLPILFVALRQMRRAAALTLPFVVPAVIVVAMLLPTLAPDLVPTFTERINPSVGTDSSLVWRENAVDATLQATSSERVSGAGFGATRTFSVGTNTFTIGSDPHNSYVWLLAGGGAIALGAFCLLLLVYVVDTTRRLLRAEGVERALVAFSLALFFVFAVNTLTGPIMTVPSLLLTFWTVLLLPSLVDASGSASAP